MAEIQFSKEEKTILANKLQGYFETELNQDLSQFEAEFLLDFIATEIGCYFYNRGLYDAEALLRNRVETISEAFYEIEKPTEFMR